MFKKNRLHGDPAGASCSHVHDTFGSAQACSNTEPLPAWNKGRPNPSPAVRTLMKEIAAPAQADVMVYRKAEPSPTVQITGAIMQGLKQTQKIIDELYVASVVYGSLEIEHNQAVRHRGNDLFDGLFRFVLGKMVHEIPVFPEIKLPPWLRLRMGDSIPSSGNIIPRDWVVCVMY